MSQTDQAQLLAQAQEELQKLKTSAVEDFQKSTSSKDLYDEKVRYMGKTGRLTEIMKVMGKLSKEDRPEFGKIVNEVKEALEGVYNREEARLKALEISAQMGREHLDLSLPGWGAERGSAHPVRLVTDEIIQILGRLGYSLRLGPQVETDFFNFEALNIPPDHPAREMQDTFFVDEHHVLRTHTSPIQIHTMMKEKPPLRVLGTGGVFRVDSDVSHLPHFHQIEGLCVDEKVSMADLKGTIQFFVREFFGSGEMKVRFRPSFFPFTEPSAEVDCTCPICKGSGCSLCKHSGWIEIGGCGLVNPKVFQHCKVDYPRWNGFAFGFGIERMAIIKYGIDDIRLIPENDLRFLNQFR